MHRFVKDMIASGETAALPRSIPALVIGCFSLLCFAGLTALIVAQRADDASGWVAHTIEVREATRDVMDSLQDAETGQRGYLLTGNTSFLEPYEAAEIALPLALTKLRTLTSDNAEQQRNIDQLSPVISDRQNLLRESIGLLRQGRRAEAIDDGRLNVGKTLMDDIRVKISSIGALEQNLLADRRAETERLRNWLLGILVFSFLAAVTLAFAGARAVRIYIETLNASKSALVTETNLRHETEATLRQSQKMEAVGQLTGGIAHDFNNLLTIVMGNLDTVQRRTAAAPAGQDAAHLATTLRKPVDMALQGCRSAAQLTHRLLAFSRRQTLEPTTLDVNRLVTGMSELLRRTLAETIQMETVLAGGLWMTHADANQLENALVNLVVNARDAMPNGGRLTIETANSFLDDAYVRRFGDITAGQYVVLCVTDTGTGISSDVIDRVFEPFFTTKDTGKGSGLGLAMVHGFIKQSKGHVRIYSEVGRGSTVKIYLPRQQNAELPISTPAGNADIATVARALPGETVLLVEDNAGVRDYGVSVLEDLGYRVIEAADAFEGLAKLAANPAISLLFTDVVLPNGLSGRDLANKVRMKRPDLPILFTTGFTRNAIVHNGTLDADVHLLNKPYTQQELGKKIRELLDMSKAAKVSVAS